MQSVTAVTSHHSDDTDLDFMALVGTLLDHKWLIGGISIAFMALGAAYSVLAPPIYQATALVQVEPKKGDMLGFSDVGSLLGKESPTVTEIELIRSRITIGTAVDNLNLDLDVKPKHFPLLGDFVARRFKPTEQEAVAAPWLGLSSFAWGGDELKFSELRLPAKLLGQELTLTAGNGGSFTLSDQDEAVLLEGQVGRAYDSNGIKLRVEQLRANPGTTFSVVRSPRLSTILRYQKLLDVAERGKESGIIGLALESPRPADAIQVLNEVARIYVRQNIDRTSAEAAQSLAFLKGQLPQVRKDVEQAEAALNQFQIRNNTIDISLEAKAILDQIVALDAIISELKMQQAEIERKFTPQQPEHRALLTPLAERSERQNELAKKVESLPTTQQELLSLTRDLKVSTEIYTLLLNKYQELDVMRAGTVGNVRLIDTADVDLRSPVRPQKALIIVIATLLGAFIAIALVMFRKALNRGVTNLNDLEKLGLPVYAAIPFSTIQKELDQKILRKDQLGGARLLPMTPPSDPAIEGLRSLRPSLLFAMLEAANNRLMISGPSPQVGKTFVSANLAAVVAHSGQRVLLVDVDMRKGYLHKVFGVSVENGLSDVLAKNCPLTAAIHHTGVDNLHFLGRGQVPPNPSELLMHAKYGYGAYSYYNYDYKSDSV